MTEIVGLLVWLALGFLLFDAIRRKFLVSETGGNTDDR